MKLNLLKDYSLLLVGATVQALCMVLFLVPGQIAAGGVSGTAQIINHYSGLPIGAMILIGNIPLFFRLEVFGRAAIPNADDQIGRASCRERV